MSPPHQVRQGQGPERRVREDQDLTPDGPKAAQAWRKLAPVAIRCEVEGFRGNRRFSKRRSGSGCKPVGYVRTPDALARNGERGVQAGVAKTPRNTRENEKRREVVLSAFSVNPCVGFVRNRSKGSPDVTLLELFIRGSRTLLLRNSLVMYGLCQFRLQREEMVRVSFGGRA